MPEIADLRAGDPAEVGGHRVVGRLGAGGQGVVYLGESPDGSRVAIKMLGAGLDDPEAGARFRQEVGYARRVKAFCTAQVLASGEYQGTPYVVSEYVDGPALAKVISERGALRGAELRRLAIGTLTALAAIHQAGVVHRDFKPGNVLLSRDGPRVIDFGISRALEETEVAGQHLVGTPPYMAPEQLGGGPVGPPADLFAWAGTMVAAGTGRPPFGTGDIPALLSRILYAEPDLGDLDGDLRELAARCLAKDPGARPTATRALLTLLGHRDERALRNTGEQRLLAEGQQSAAPPRRRRWPLVAGAAGLAVAVTVAVLLLRPVPAPRPPAPAPVPLPTPRPGAMARTSVSELKLPNGNIVLHENPADPVWVSSYLDLRTGSETHIRNPATGAFTFFGSFEQPVASPGGRFVGSTSIARSRGIDFESIRLLDRAIGQDREVPAVEPSRTLYALFWSGDGRRLLATVEDRSEKRAVGFAVLDAVTGSVKITETAGADEARYRWGSDGNSVLQQAPDGAVRVLDLNGRVLRSLPEVGVPTGGGTVTTTLGTIFNTICPKKSRNICFWDERTGAKKGEIRLPEDGSFHGWLDERHILAITRDSEKAEVIMADATGKPVRTLVTAPRKEFDKVTFWFTRK
ncbi:serine/threonine-protein kinase [Nonomuraea sp. NPDC050404]|uniref:serine/threonine protein kinase n=1 Tax=Nonomuraea sp. NPDC050404 TaxID=3155783 RepID=UPI0033C5180A